MGDYLVLVVVDKLVLKVDMVKEDGVFVGIDDVCKREFV